MLKEEDCERNAWLCQVLGFKRLAPYRTDKARPNYGKARELRMALQAEAAPPGPRKKRRKQEKGAPPGSGLTLEMAGAAGQSAPHAPGLAGETAGSGDAAHTPGDHDPRQRQKQVEGGHGPRQSHAEAVSGIGAAFKEEKAKRNHGATSERVEETALGSPERERLQRGAERKLRRQDAALEEGGGSRTRKKMEKRKKEAAIEQKETSLQGAEKEQRGLQELPEGVAPDARQERIRRKRAEAERRRVEGRLQSFTKPTLKQPQGAKQDPQQSSGKKRQQGQAGEQRSKVSTPQSAADHPALTKAQKKNLARSKRRARGNSEA